MTGAVQAPVVPALYGSRSTVVNNSRHNAFGGVVKMPNGNLLAVYRDGSNHVSTDSKFVKQTSTDNGATWSAASTIYDPAIEVRDIALAVIGSTIVASFFDWDGTASGYTTRTMRSTDNGATWDTPVAITDHGYGYYAACSGPVVVAPNGNWLLPLYGLDASSETVGYCRVVESTDGGNSWHQRAVVAPKVEGESSEGNIVVLDNGTLLCLMRRDAGTLLIKSTSTDNGATWSARSTAVSGGSGRPAVMQTARGDVRMMYRAGVGGPTRWRNSWDRGVTWSTERDFSGGQSTSYTYGQWVQIASGGDGATGAFWSTEVGDTNADCYFQRFADDALAP